ncbi:MAG: hypothetical protein ACFCD0_15545 [Gemmataceae bacterium]
MNALTMKRMMTSRLFRFFENRGYEEGRKVVLELGRREIQREIHLKFLEMSRGAIPAEILNAIHSESSSDLDQWIVKFLTA